MLNGLLRLCRGGGLRIEGYEISEHIARFDDEFSCLDAANAAAGVIRGCRSAAHLNWRYREDPLNDYRVLVVRRKGELVAFLVFLITGASIKIVDLFGRDLPESAVLLLDALVRRYQGSYQSIEFFLSEGCDIMPSVLKAGFFRRSVAAQVVAYAEPGGETSVFLKRRPRWAFDTAEVQA
jgi:hypothetical protein